MNFERMKPDLKNLDLDKLKRGVAERIPHVSVEMNRKRWIVLVCALLTAPQDGIVLTRAREAGAIVQAGQTVYTLSLVDPVWLRVYVDEPQLGRIKPGMAVRVRVDAVPDKEFSGRVGFISPAAEFTPKSVETMEVRTSLVYRLRVQVDDPDNVMRQGMPVTVTLVEP